MIKNITIDENLSNQIQQAIIDVAKDVHINTYQYQGMSQIDKFNARYGNCSEKALKK